MRIMMIMQFRLYFYILKTFATKSFVTWFGDNEQKRDLNIFFSFDQQKKKDSEIKIGLKLKFL